MKINHSLSAIAVLAGILALASVSTSQRQVLKEAPLRLAPLPNLILETTDHNPAPNFNINSPSWAEDLVHGQTIFSITNSCPYEWTQVLAPNEDYDDDFVACSGWVLGADISPSDDPFIHPFCSVDKSTFDTEFVIAPDSQYQSLAARETPGHTPDTEIADAIKASAGLGHPIQNALGCETDSGLVPPIYRPVLNDRVALWGRWIVDTGHDDFHTEIHPPAMMVAARAEPPGSTEKTQITVIGRPYLVGQTFQVDGKPLVGHLLNEYEKTKEFRSTRIEAHPNIMPKPFRGVHLMSFIVRPPSGRRSPSDHLDATFHFTVRTGVAIQVVNQGDYVKVLVVFNDAQYVAPPLPRNRGQSISVSDLKRLNSDAGDAYEGAIFGSILLPGNPLAVAFDARGILTDAYDSPQPKLGQTYSMDVKSLPGNLPVSHDDSQPFPIAGSLSLTWKRNVQLGIHK